MEIIEANKSHKKITLELLDEFRAECMKIINPGEHIITKTARSFGGKIFDEVVGSPESVIFLAKNRNKFIGIVTVYRKPQIRKGSYYAEIEEFYVVPMFQGKGVAKQLIDSVVKWAKKRDVECIRLESDNELKRGHAFYEKYGFDFYGRAYRKAI
jgi:GNAT superfamily N-acetyltransferase